MKITGIKIRKIYTDRAIRAVVSILIDDSIAIHELKVVEGRERLFVAMPSRKELSGEFRDIVHPLNATVRAEIENAVLEEYNRVLNEMLYEGQPRLSYSSADEESYDDPV